MGLEQISKAVYESISYRQNSDPSDLINSLFRDFWDLNGVTIGPHTVSAFIHKSFKHENNISFNHNENLEFFGDSVLQLIVSEYLISEFPEFSEGELSKLRSQIVNESSLATLAKNLNLPKWILLGKGEMKENGHTKESILSDTFEALLGAIYLDAGLDQAKLFLFQVFKTFEREFEESFIQYAKRSSQDVKTTLQEIVMKKFKTTPEYKTLSLLKEGKEIFQVELWVNNKSLGKVLHPSKKRAMQMVAKTALENNLV